MSALWSYKANYDKIEGRYLSIYTALVALSALSLVCGYGGRRSLRLLTCGWSITTEGSHAI